MFAVKRGEIYGVIDVKRFTVPLNKGYKSKVSDYCDILDVKVNAADLDTELVDWIRIDDLENDPIDFSARTLSACEMEGSFFEVARGDILVARLGPTILNQKIVLVDTTLRRTLASSEFLVLRCKGICTPEEVLCAVRTEYYKNLMYSHSRGSTPSRYRLNREDMLNLSFPAMNKHTLKQAALMQQAQGHRAAKLREADALLAGMDEYIREKIGLPEEINSRPMCFATMVSQKGRFDPEFYNPFYQHRVARIKAMKHDRLENIVEFSSETWNQSSDFVDMFPYIEISGVGLKSNEYALTPTPIAEAPSRAKMVVRDRDIIVSMTRPHRGAIATITCDDGYYVASTGFCVLRKLKRKDITREYLQWVLLNEYILQQFLQRSSGGNYPAIIQDEIKKVLIPIPDESIQREIVAEATSRKNTARAKCIEAEAEWAAAKVRFERELLSPEAEMTNCLDIPKDPTNSL
ncbi:MAG: restriction endonuclease subunit S [Treponema sp.]|nr:restriction endonuclease subunit S [Treponema sp.]